MSDDTTAKKATKKSAKSITIQLSNCKYDVLRQVSGELGYTIVEEGSPWVLFWIDTGVSFERILSMKSYQKINHFPGMHEICRKDHLARKVARLCKLFPKEFNFFPQSWILPMDWKEFCHSFKPKKGQCFIMKPDHGCQGKGITLFKNPSNIQDPLSQDVVIQSYISNPYLIDGFKFDLRIYVLVTSVNPLRVFIYKDGLARFATELYSTPSEKNLSKLCMHLTNYAINKNSKSFIKDDPKGSKRTIKSVLEELKEKGNVNTESVWNRIKDAVVKTILSVQPALSKFPKPWFPNDPSSSLKNCGSQCFEILGFDILLDSKLKPWVLEVNHSPSFACDSKLDLDIKSGLLKDTLRLLNLNANASKKYTKDEKLKSISRLILTKKKSADGEVRSTKREDSSATMVQEASIGSEIMPSTYQEALDKYHKEYHPRLLEKLSDWEDKRLGEFERAFPPSDPKQLGKYLYLVSVTGKKTETTALRNKIAYLAAKEEEEQEKKRRLDQWKIKQRNSHVQSKVGHMLDRAADLDEQFVCSEVQSMKSFKRSLHAHQLKFSCSGQSSPIPDYFSHKATEFKHSYLRSEPHYLKKSSSNVLTIPRQSLSQQVLMPWSDILKINPIIKQKQLELCDLQATVNSRIRARARSSSRLQLQ